MMIELHNGAYLLWKVFLEGDKLLPFRESVCDSISRDLFCRPISSSLRADSYERSDNLQVSEKSYPFYYVAEIENGCCNYTMKP
jgi:hypothetical protein